MQNLNKAIFKIVDYEFKNNALLQEALTHPSVNKKNSKNKPLSYERLEFLGDSVLNMIVSAMIFDLFPDEEEGSLAKRKMYLVCGSAIANIAKEIGLANFIIINNSERCNGGLSNLKNLENSLEALIGAMYIDGGLLIVKRFVIKHWEKLAKKALDPPQDPKLHYKNGLRKTSSLYQNICLSKKMVLLINLNLLYQFA